MKKKLCLSFLFVLHSTVFSLFSQSAIGLTMDRAIALAQSQSIESMAVKNTFLANYWTFRAFQASRLPSLNFTADIANFDRSRIPLQNYDTGEISYRPNYNMYNQGTISIDQNIFATGGTLSVYSSLNRLDQWKPSREITYYSRPVTLSYLQPLWTFNSFKWDRKIEPENYESAKRQYLENMENVTILAVEKFFNLLLKQMSYDLTVNNYANTREMYGIAVKRFELAEYDKASILQLELRMLNDSLAINIKENELSSARMELKSYLGLSEYLDIEIVLPEEVPDLEIDPAEALDKAFENSSFLIEQRILELEGQRGVAQAKGSRGISAQLTTQFGLSNDANRFNSSYRGLIDYEIVGLTLRIPIMDWGMGKGRVKVAQSQLETTRNRIEQAVTDFRQELYVQVMQFNSQRQQLRIASRAHEIAQERYRLTLSNFSNGTVSVTDLNTAQSEKDEAFGNFITELSNYWKYYFNLRKITLYDYISKTDISAEYDKLVN